ncbi:hypothetical protein PoB_000594600 [Plakobranchus ocellatus]|uniref:Uncharacterized protein n=1 Tax=Plakobranchus ocellatus TaxID=259542 RepID=A0AAV3Y8A0_9GAST|nr:hypothetical protein PoB_000594600 [Plakobranchus ocellatus]
MHATPSLQCDLRLSGPRLIRAWVADHPLLPFQGVFTNNGPTNAPGVTVDVFGKTFPKCGLLVNRRCAAASLHTRPEHVDLVGCKTTLFTTTRPRRLRYSG